jgi:uncharacterized protein
MVQRHVPERTCVACRETQPKRALVRVVRTPADGVVLDESGKRSGRGAYLCRSADCWQKGLCREVLARALKTDLTAADRAALEQFAMSLSAGPPREPAGPAGGSAT